MESWLFRLLWQLLSLVFCPRPGFVTCSRHSKKLPAWAMSVRPKFNRTPEPTTEQKTVAAEMVVDTSVSAVPKTRVLVLHSNRQNSQDFKTLGLNERMPFPCYYGSCAFFTDARLDCGSQDIMMIGKKSMRFQHDLWIGPRVAPFTVF